MRFKGDPFGAFDCAQGRLRSPRHGSTLLTTERSGQAGQVFGLGRDFFVAFGANGGIILLTAAESTALMWAHRLVRDD